MSFIPDEAIDAAASISPTSFRIYCEICRWRNHKHQNAILRPEAWITRLEVSRSQLYRSLRELEKKGWIVRNNIFTVPIFGSFEPVNRTQNGAPPQRQGAPPQRQKVSPMARAYKEIQPLNQPLSIQPLAKRPKKQKCTFCKKGYFTDQHTHKQVPCFICDQGQSLSPYRNLVDRD